MKGWGWLALGWLALHPVPALAEGLESNVRRGPVELRVQVEPESPVIGDAIELQVEVLAESGVELLMPEFAEALDRYLILDFAPREEIADDGRTRSVQRYTLQPPSSGPTSIPPILVEFVDRRPGSRPAPEGADAYELLSERIDFEVKSVLPEAAGHDLRPMPGELRSHTAQWLPWWGWLLGAVLTIVLGGPFAFRAWQAYSTRSRQRSAYQVACEDLDALLAWGSRPRAEDVEKFYVELSGIIRHYLENRFDLRSPELTTEEFLSIASRSPDLGAAHRGLLREFLSRADLVKFAGLRPGQDEIDESIAAARRFLEETRESTDATVGTSFHGVAA